MRLPLGWLLWVMLMASTNMIGGLIFIERLEGQIVLLTLLVSFLLMSMIYARLGFVRLLGLAHVPWIVMVPWLYSQYPKAMDPWFREWILIVVSINLVSLVIDFVDVTRYLLGERGE